MKFDLPFKNFKYIPVPKLLPKILAWTIMAFGAFVIILGAIVRDDTPAMAQTQGAPDAQNTQIVQPESNTPSDVQPEPNTPSTAHPESNTPSAAQPEPNTPSAAQPEPNTPSTAQPEPNTPSTAQPESNTPSTAQPESNTNTDAPKPNAIALKDRSKESTSLFSRIMSVTGIFAFIGIAWLLSSHRKKVLWKLVAVGTAMQLLFALFILRTSVGMAIFAFLNDAVNVLLGFTNAGTSFLFSSYVTGQIEPGLVNTAMSILPPIIFFSSLMTVLYYFGVMQWIVRGMAYVMMKFMGTSGSESLSSVANIFVGMTEAPLVVKPYVATMTRSELFAIMTGGMATVAGGVMASYVAMLQPFFPDIAGHLIAASVMSAPASLVVAKIMIPETETSETMGKVKLDMPKTDANVIDAAARGAGEGLQLALNVAAMLLAFVAIIALINFILGLPGRIVNANTYEHVNAYLVANGGTEDPNCNAPYSTSDTVACTHQALVQIATLKHITVPQNLTTLQGDQGNHIDQTDALYTLITDAIGPIQADTPDAPAQTPETQLQQKSLWPLLSLQTILGWLFFPFAFLMGVPVSDCFLVAQLLGEKMAVNEFVAYLHLAQITDQLSSRSILIASYALCGFANFGSIAIQIGGIGGMAPNRRADIAKLGIRSMIAGTIAAFITATIAGALA